MIKKKWILVPLPLLVVAVEEKKRETKMKKERCRGGKGEGGGRAVEPKREHYNTLSSKNPIPIPPRKLQQYPIPTDRQTNIPPQQQ